MQPPDPDAPVVLQSLHIEHLRGVPALTLEPRVDERTDRGQWLLLLGDNGVGKSTLLRALALATADEKVAWTLLEQLGGSWISRGHTEGLARGVLNDRVWEQRYFAVGSQLEVSGVRGETPMVLGYGVERGGALGGPDRSVRLEAQSEGRTTLFRGGALVHAETWLMRLAFAAERAPSEGDFFRAVCQTLLGLLPGIEDIHVEPDGVWLAGPQIGRTDLASLSDGYLTTLGWIVDLIARWSQLARESAGRVDGDFRHRMTGLVLIDELDLHLHPRWQLTIVDQLRAAFPRLSFVATTHNPLTLRGAREGEVHVMERVEGQVEVRQIDVPPGARADDLLTGRWFGLTSTLDQDTLDFIAKYQERVRARASRNELLVLEEELRGRLGSFADTHEERLALRVVAESSEHKTLDDDDLEELRSRMAALMTEAPDAPVH